MKAIMVGAALLAATGACAAEFNSGVLSPPPGFRWEGFYAGGNIGGAWGTGDSFGYEGFQQYKNLAGLYVQPMIPSRLTGGGQVGYNTQSGKIIVGAESDFSFGGSSSGNKVDAFATFGGISYASTQEVRSEIDWFGSVRVRLGIAPVDRLLIFATAGLAYAQVSNSFYNATYPSLFGSQPFGQSSSKTNVGWVAGAGVEYALTNNLSIRGEAMYFDLGQTNMYIDLYNISYGGELTMGIARAAVNYLF